VADAPPSTGVFIIYCHFNPFDPLKLTTWLAGTGYAHVKLILPTAFITLPLGVSKCLRRQESGPAILAVPMVGL
jgi:hypothetical protein